MIVYNFDRIFKARGITRPFTFLKSHGFSTDQANRYSHNRLKGLQMSVLERLCLLLNCTPHDLMEWIPDEGMEYGPDVALNKLRKSGESGDFDQTIWSIPLSKVDEINQMIKEKLKEE